MEWNEARERDCAERSVMLCMAKEGFERVQLLSR